MVQRYRFNTAMTMKFDGGVENDDDIACMYTYDHLKQYYMFIMTAT